MALVAYSSSSESEDDVGPPKSKILKTTFEKRLPLPSAISCLNKVTYTSPVDNPSEHDGRIRSFEHERGNWATFVYIPVELNIIDELLTTLKERIDNSADLKQSDNIHISLTKTVILRHHWIKTFVESIQKSLIAIQHFPLDFHSLNVYTNEEKTRTFVGLVASEVYFEKLHRLMLKMDAVMNEFRLDTFYENPSFHASLLWCVGDHEKALKDKLPELNEILLEMRKTCLDDFRIMVNELHCKLGNKNFEFKLK